MNSSSRSDDVDLLRRLRRGEEDAFMTIYRRHQAPVYRFALRMSGSPAAAEDVTQEVFMALLTGGSRYDETRGALRSYLYGVARNQVARRLERAREVPLEADPGVRVAAARGEDLAALREALQALPVPFREVVVLCELEGLSYEEAARVCAVPVGTIRSRLHRARAQLVASLGGHASPPAPHSPPEEPRP
jgi:RNA polymerase sigma-70 factor (ECF subfamily)